MTWAYLDLPKEWNARISSLAEECQWEVRESELGTRIATRESYQKRPGNLVSLFRIADAHNASDEERFKRVVERLAPPDHVRSAEGPVDVALQRATREYLASADDAEWWYGFQLLGLASIRSELAKRLGSTFREGVLRRQPKGSLWVLSVDPALDWRMTAVRVLFAASVTPELLDRPPQDFRGFHAGKGFLDASGLSCQGFVEPALVSLAPWVLGITSTRADGLLVVLFGDPELGLKSTAAPELLHLYRPISAPSDAGPKPQLSAQDIEGFFSWWVTRVNHLLTMLSDVGMFVDSNGRYSASDHFGAVLSVERLFACVQDILACTIRDEFARQALFFDAIDILEGLNCGGARDLLTIQTVSETIDSIASGAPSAVSAVVLPRCSEALDALRAVGEEFRLTERITPQGLQLPSKKGAVEVVSLQHAIADFLRVARNASHSFRTIVRNPRSLALIAAHSARIDPRLADIAWVHLLGVLMKPERLFPQRARAARKGAGSS